MAWTALDFTAFQTLTAAQMDQIYANMAGLKDGTLFDAGAIKPNALNSSGSTSSWAAVSWTPTWSNLTVGNGTVNARYSLIGKSVRIWINITLGSTSAVSSGPSFTLPFTPSSNYVADITNGSVFGNVRYLDAGSAEYGGFTKYTASNTLGLYLWNSAGTFITGAGVNSTSPFTWGTSDVINIWATYEAA